MDDYEAEQEYRRQQQEDNSREKRCYIDWFGLKTGPFYVAPRPEIQSRADFDREFSKRHRLFDVVDLDSEENEELSKLTKAFRRSLGDELFSIYKMKKFAEDHGWKVMWTVYDESPGIIDEALSDGEEKEFIKALKAGEVEFKYHKVSGEIRKARGTLNPDLMDIKPKTTDAAIEGGKKKHFVPPTVFIYWDLDAKAFRSFRKDNFIEFKTVESKDEEKKDDED